MKKIMTFLIAFYQQAISPYIRPRCRYVPSCSDYMKQTIQEHGALKGIALGIKRILRCQPFGGSGYDPIPSKSTEVSF